MVESVAKLTGFGQAVQAAAPALVQGGKEDIDHLKNRQGLHNLSLFLSL